MLAIMRLNRGGYLGREVTVWGKVPMNVQLLWCPLFRNESTDLQSAEQPAACPAELAASHWAHMATQLVGAMLVRASMHRDASHGKLGVEQWDCCKSGMTREMELLGRGLEGLAVLFVMAGQAGPRVPRLDYPRPALAFEGRLGPVHGCLQGSLLPGCVLPQHGVHTTSSGNNLLSDHPIKSVLDPSSFPDSRPTSMCSRIGNSRSGSIQESARGSGSLVNFLGEALDASVLLATINAATPPSAGHGARGASIR